MKLVLMLLSIFFLNSCAKNNQAFSSRLYLDNMESLPADLQAKVISAIKQINSDAGGELISFQSKSSNQRPLVLISGFSGTTLAHAQTLEYRCLISINNNSVVNNNDSLLVNLRFVLLHEIGHCYNLNHDDRSIYNIMNSSYAGTEYLNPGETSIIINNITDFANFLLNSEP